MLPELVSLLRVRISSRNIAINAMHVPMLQMKRANRSHSQHETHLPKASLLVACIKACCLASCIFEFSFAVFPIRQYSIRMLQFTVANCRMMPISNFLQSNSLEM